LTKSNSVAECKYEAIASAISRVAKFYTV